MQGVDNALPTDISDVANLTTGMLEAHEYFHSLQRIPIMNRGVEKWPHAWWREGSAEWVKNATINYTNFELYKNFLRDVCSYSCQPLSEADIAEFLTLADGNSLPSKFDQFLNYSLGQHVIEILVALKDADVLIDMYAEMGHGLSFSDAFNKIFGLTWSSAIPIIAKSIYRDLH